MENTTLDISRFKWKISQLTSKELRKVSRNAMKDGMRMLQRKTRGNLRKTVKANQPNWWNNKKLSNGVLLSSDRKGEWCKVHLMGDFRLKYFEMGTKERSTKYVTKKDSSKKLIQRASYKKNYGGVRTRTTYSGKNRGQIKKGEFFKHAQDTTLPTIIKDMDAKVIKAVDKIQNKK